MSNNFKRPLASSHNAQPAEQIQQNGYHSAPGSFPLKGSHQFKVPFPDAPTAPLPGLAATPSVGVPAKPLIDTPGLENKRMRLKSIISTQLQLPSRKAEVPITEQSTDVHAAFPARPPFRPLPAYSEQQVIGKKTLFSLLVGFDLLANILELAHVNFLYTTTLISLCTSILLPGFLITLILRLRKISFWENLLFIVGLGIAFLEFGGLLLNVLLPLFDVNNPLAFQNIVYGFDVFLLLLFVFAWVRTKHLEVKIQLPRRSKIEKVLYTLPVFFPVLATLGAIVLNNGGSNTLTLILLGAIAVYSLLLVLFRDKIAVDLYPYAIFFIGIACLFTTSLRSWYITGHDIEREFYVFQLTNAHHIWNMAFYQNAYNACLSITILPTILTNLLSIQDMYVYKVIFQILFATSPIVVFFIVRNYTTPVLAFLSAFFFMSFPTFFNDMPMLNRQEIGFIFFGLVLYMMLLSELSFSMRKILFIIFALSVVVSHYSTNFVLLALVTFVYVSTLIISLPFVKNIFARLLPKSHTTLKNTFTNKKFLALPLILLLFLMTYFWNNLYTNSSNQTGSVMAEIISSILLKSNAKSSDISYSIFSFYKPDPNQELQKYIRSIQQSAGNENTSHFYNKSINSKYASYPLTQEQLAPTPVGNWLSSFHIPVFNVQTGLRSLSAYFMQISVFIGLLAVFFFKKKEPFDVQHLLLFFKKKKPKKAFDLQYLFLCFGAIFLLVLMTVLPAISIEYGLLRMFQQLLFILSLPIVLAVWSTLFFVKEQKRILFTGIIAIIFFLNLTGFISHLTGDYYPQLTLDNAGLYYDAYYVHKSDVLAIAWLSENNVNNEPVQADLPGTNKLLTYGDIDALSGIFPQIIRKNAYVYQQVSIHIEVILDNTIIVCNSSKPFLDENKDHVYSNGQVNIYK